MTENLERCGRCGKPAVKIILFDDDSFEGFCQEHLVELDKEDEEE